MKNILYALVGIVLLIASVLMALAMITRSLGNPEATNYFAFFCITASVFMFSVSCLLRSVEK